MLNQEQLNVTLCGGGNAIHVMTADLADEDRNGRFAVSIFAPYQDEAERLRNGVESQGYIARMYRDEEPKRGRPVKISSEAKEVIPDADVILLPIPSFGHESVLKAIAPFVKEGAVIAAIPGQGGFEWIAKRELGEMADKVVLVGTNTLPYICRTSEFGKSVDLFGYKTRIYAASIPANRVEEMSALLEDIFGILEVRPWSHYLTITLTPANQIVHPAIMYQLFHEYKEGETLYDEPPLFYRNVDDIAEDLMIRSGNELQNMARLMEEKLDIDLSAVPTTEDMLRELYIHEIEDASSLKRMFQTNKGYQGLTAPMIQQGDKYIPNFQHRYLTEDVPNGLCILYGLAEMLEIETPAILQMLRWCQTVMGREYLDENDQLRGKDAKFAHSPQALGIVDLMELK